MMSPNADQWVVSHVESSGVLGYQHMLYRVDSIAAAAAKKKKKKKIASSSSSAVIDCRHYCSRPRRLPPKNGAENVDIDTRKQRITSHHPRLL
jgi:hypothetical protein